VSCAVSFVRHPAHQMAPRYDTDAQNTALMRHFVVSDLVSVRMGFRGSPVRIPPSRLTSFKPCNGH
jgi:hypothetical protein